MEVRVTYHILAHCCNGTSRGQKRYGSPKFLDREDSRQHFDPNVLELNHHGWSVVHLQCDDA
jgi:hypothetical protein